MNSSNNNSSNINNDPSSTLLDGLSIGHRVASFLSLGDVDGFGAMFFDTDSRGNAVPVYSPADANRPTPDSEESSVDLLERGMQQLFLPEEPQTNSPSLSPERTSFPSEIDPGSAQTTLQIQQRGTLVKKVMGRVLNKVPLSLALELFSHFSVTSLKTGSAVYTISKDTVKAGLAMVAHSVRRIWAYICSLSLQDLLRVLNTFKDATFGYVTKIASQRWNDATYAVEEGKKSASIAIHYLAGTAEYGDKKGKGASRRGSGGGQGMEGQRINEALLRRLDRINKTSKVVSYCEREEVITRNAKKRVQRMMHYSVSLKPFVATVEAGNKAMQMNESLPNQPPPSPQRSGRSNSGDDEDKYSKLELINSSSNLKPSNSDSSFTSQTSQSSPPKTPPDRSESPFMCTPQSFPPTPGARSFVMARSTQFAEDVIFLARDQLRVEQYSESSNEKTRAVAEALRQQSRLAVWNAQDTGNGIKLTCGQHCATKVGNTLYCSTRSMVPVLRNCYVYFELNIGAPAQDHDMASLSIGLSTQEMPLNTLVGSWKGSVGLCTTGQILDAGRWTSTLDTKLASFGHEATVGCLVFIDDDTEFQTWDGEMVNAQVTFSVNGRVVKGLTESPELTLAIPKEEELFPTVTLHSANTQIHAMFCSQDLQASTREECGAPDGEIIYALDGSVLFEEGAGGGGGGGAGLGELGADLGDDEIENNV
ncbi:hypothetical protein TL16_g07085 [Triparma laevis f. inornata]|uniref:SPRY domain-containing protein n=2 Tax=Triparma laevis TaxID=1534972 RepID=A0A9W7FQG0_9STRA|nr:hypothetical protein TL16_g07085 [Triparma laevis f. inornata]GMI17079.1 hypothetical protein TrLO_g9653 [Triparma laevis f. longispina]